MTETRTKEVVRRALLGVLIALAAILGFEVSLRLAEPHLPEPDPWPSGELSTKVGQMEILGASSDVEVVFVGSSVVAEGIDPIAFRDSSGHIAYNAGLSAASMRSVEIWVEDVVLPLTNPSTIVIGVTGRDLNDHGISQTDFYERLTNAPGYLVLREPTTVAERVEDWFYENSATIRLRPVLSDPGLFAEELGLEDRGDEDDSEVGPFGSDTSYRGEGYADLHEWRTAWLARHLNDYSIGDSEADALRRLLEALAQEGIDVLVVNMPTTSDYVETLPEGDRDAAEFDIVLEQIVAEAGVAYFNAKDRYDLDDFRDPAHLTPTAASDLARELARMTSTTIEPSSDL